MKEGFQEGEEDRAWECREGPTRGSDQEGGSLGSERSLRERSMLFS